MVEFDKDGNRIETPWRDVEEETHSEIRVNLTERFMAAAGYERVGQA